MIYLFLANGFEEIEALATVDVLRRCSLETKTVSIGSSKNVDGAHGMIVCADLLFSEISENSADALVLPGGMPGADNLSKHDELACLLKEQNAKGKLIAAICAAPMVLGKLGLLDGRKATCYPGFESYLKGATPTGNMVEIDGNIITGKGPAAAIPFATAIASRFVDGKKVKEVLEGMLF